jgi:hypothetical protein
MPAARRCQRKRGAPVSRRGWKRGRGRPSLLCSRFTVRARPSFRLRGSRLLKRASGRECSTGLAVLNLCIGYLPTSAPPSFSS